MTNEEIAAALKQTGQLIELTGGNAFRARAFENAARTLGRLEESVRTRAVEGTLTEIDGIGDGLAEDVRSLVETGSFPGRDELLDELPEELPDLLRIKGLGTKKVRAIWQELDVHSLDGLEEAARSGRLTGLSGFGPKTRDRVLEQIELVRSYMGRSLLPEAVREGESLCAELEALDDVRRAVPAGAARRAMETVSELVIVCATERADRIDGVLPDRSDSGLPVRVHAVPPESFGTELWLHTGSSAHVERFRERYGTPGTHATEEELYAEAGLSLVPPELREDRGELGRAEGEQPRRLLEISDLAGSVHAHTTYSDGSHTVEEMAQAARRLGRSYLVISDHSQSLQVAGGLGPEEVRRQRREIDALNEAWASRGVSSFRLFAGIESDVLPDGSLDYSDRVLAEFDVVIASVHSRFEMDRAEATDRIIRAVSNPHTDILGHPTGRLLLRREGYPLDHERIIAACAEQEVAIELNANPRRFDLDWRWIAAAAEAGVPISINPDAHNTDQLRYERWGVRVARKGGLTASDCLNARPVEAFERWLSRRTS